MSRTSVYRRMASAFLLLMAITVCGCSEKLPDVVPATGVVTYRGAPLFNAEIKFIPMHDKLDGNFVASGVTDSKGEFTLSLQGKTESGCCACECKVLVNEGPIPGDRGQDERSIMEGLKFRKSLKNRPIPAKYERVGTTPLTFNVTAENNRFEIELTE